MRILYSIQVSYNLLLCHWVRVSQVIRHAWLVRHAQSSTTVSACIWYQYVIAGELTNILINKEYSQCIPSTGTTASSATSASNTATQTTTTTTATSTSATATATSTGKLQFYGVNIAGFDFGCDTSGDCTESAAWPPLTKYYGMDGAGQMQHFVNDDGFNLFRLPVGWQFLTGDLQSGTIVDANLQEYDDLVQTCLSTGASCIIDVHNYARFNGEVGNTTNLLRLPN